MTTYIGIDLGTTNSAICTFDGQRPQIYKSPDQNDVTPSAIFIDKRGNRFVGMRAYNNAAKNPDSAATLFKRLIGTSTPIRLPAVNMSMTPEDCSSEILRTLFGYLPEAIRNDPDIGTVITVPAAFNQMQKDATIEAAKAAGLGKVALMQEPVAAVMSVMRSRRGDGTFLVYDLGGGTLDIAIAQSTGGRVSLLGQGGIAMCGGRDFDRRIVDNLVIPWLLDTFDLPEDFSAEPQYKTLRRMAEHAAEKAKIELSSREEAIVSASENEIGARDRSGNEIYIDVPVTALQLDGLIEDKIEESVRAAREAIERAGLSPHDIERVVFVGGPTQYKALRTKVAFELGIAGSTDVNPMTAVAEGASVFAEAIDWASQSRSRKSARGTVTAGTSLRMTLNYVSRTPDNRAKVAMKLGQPPLPGSEYQVDSLDTGWSSGRAALQDGAVFEVPLLKQGENAFKLFVFDPSGGPVRLEQDRIIITLTAATVDAIPASHSIAVEVLDKVGGSSVLDYLVKAGDQLPARGQLRFKAEESLRAGAAGSLKFKIWEGDIEHPISNNSFIGLFEIRGSDFAEGVIIAGSDLILNFEITDSGVIDVDVDVPSVSGSFGKSGRNFYSRSTGLVDYSQAADRIREDAEGTAQRIEQLSAKVGNRDFDLAKERIERAMSLSSTNLDPEAAKQAYDDVQEAKRLYAEGRRANLSVVRRSELDQVVANFEELARQYAKPTELAAFEKLRVAAESLIARPSQDFEARLREMNSKIFGVLMRQDWFMVDRFNWYDQTGGHLFADRRLYDQLIMEGRKAVAAGDVGQVRAVVEGLDRSRVRPAEAESLIVESNIIRG